MTYDYAGPWGDYAGHNSPLFASSKQPAGTPRSTERTMDYLVKERGLPADRLAVGLPLYGRGFPVTVPYASTKGVAKGRHTAGGYRDYHELLAKGGWTRRWDDQTKNPWLISADGKGVIGYDDAESLTLRTDWAMKHGFRGVFFWQIAADRLPDGSNPLQDAAHKVWDKDARPGTP